jgi:hypothetical protein
MPVRPLRALALAATVAALGLIAGCGSDDFENEPRPPAPIELTAAIDADSINISPSGFGAGLVNITISNQGDAPTTLTLEGPTSVSSGEIEPSGTGSIKTSLEQGTYEAKASALGVDPAELVVGPERDSSQNDLLLP